MSRVVKFRSARARRRSFTLTASRPSFGDGGRCACSLMLRSGGPRNFLLGEQCSAFDSTSLALPPLSPGASCNSAYARDAHGTFGPCVPRADGSCEFVHPCAFTSDLKMWLYDRWGTSLHVCRAQFQFVAPASWEIHTRFITQIRQWWILRSRDHISGPLSFQKLMSGSTDSRTLALYFTHVLEL